MSLGHGADLNEVQQKEYDRLRRKLDAGMMPLKRVILGECAGCGRPLPAGGLYEVPKVATVNENGYQRRIFKEAYCRQPCRARDGRNSAVQPSEVPAKPTDATERVKTIAKGILTSMAKLESNVLIGPKWVIKQLGLADGDLSLVSVLLKKLSQAVKVTEVATEKGLRYKRK